MDWVLGTVGLMRCNVLLGNSKEQEFKDEQQRMNNKFNKDYNSIAGIMKDKYDEDIKNEPKRQRYL